MEPTPREQREEEIAEATREYVWTRQRMWRILAVMLLSATFLAGDIFDRFFGNLILLLLACGGGYLLYRRRHRIPEVTARALPLVPAKQVWKSDFFDLGIVVIWAVATYSSLELPLRFQPLLVLIGFTALTAELLIPQWYPQQTREDAKAPGLFIGFLISYVAALLMIVDVIPLQRVIEHGVSRVITSFEIFGIFYLFISSCWIIGDIFYARQQVRRLQHLVNDLPPAGADGTD